MSTVLYNSHLSWSVRYQDLVVVPRLTTKDHPTRRRAPGIFLHSHTLPLLQKVMSETSSSEVLAPFPEHSGQVINWEPEIPTPDYTEAFRGATSKTYGKTELSALVYGQFLKGAMPFSKSPQIFKSQCGTLSVLCINDYTPSKA